MAWTKPQKMRFAEACRAIGLDAEARHEVLSVLPNAHCGKTHPTSTSPKLNNGDFERAMAIVEAQTPGQRIVLKTKTWGALHFARKVQGDTSRMNRRVRHLVDAIKAKVPSFDLPAFISRQTGGDKDRVELLEYRETQKLIEALKGCCRTYKVKVD